MQPAHAAHRRIKRQRRQFGDALCHLVGTRQHLVAVGKTFRDKASRGGFLGVDQLRSQQHIFDPCFTDEPDKPAQIANGKTIAKGAGDRRADLQIAAADPDIHCRRDGRTASGAESVQRADGWHAAFLYCGQRAIDHLFVIDRILCGECPELRNVGAGGKGGVTTAGENQHPHIIRVGVSANDRADLLDPVIHAEGQRVAPMRPVHDDVTNPVGHAVEKFPIFPDGVFRDGVFPHGCLLIVAVRPRWHFQRGIVSPPGRRRTGGGYRPPEVPFRPRSAFRSASDR